LEKTNERNITAFSNKRVYLFPTKVSSSVSVPKHSPFSPDIETIRSFNMWVFMVNLTKPSVVQGIQCRIEQSASHSDLFFGVADFNTKLRDALNGGKFNAEIADLG
jgi:hypothetical protein